MMRRKCQLCAKLKRQPLRNTTYFLHEMTTDMSTVGLRLMNAFPVPLCAFDIMRETGKIYPLLKSNFHFQVFACDFHFTEAKKLP